MPPLIYENTFHIQVGKMLFLQRGVGYYDSRSERDSADAGERRILLKNFNLFSCKHDLPSPSQDLLESRLHRKSIPNL